MESPTTTAHTPPVKGSERDTSNSMGRVTTNIPLHLYSRTEVCGQCFPVAQDMTFTETGCPTLGKEDGEKYLTPEDRELSALMSYANAQIVNKELPEVDPEMCQRKMVYLGHSTESTVRRQFEFRQIMAYIDEFKTFLHAFSDAGATKDGLTALAGRCGDLEACVRAIYINDEGIPKEMGEAIGSSSDDDKA